MLLPGSPTRTPSPGCEAETRRRDSIVIRAGHNAPKNTHAGPVDEADPLDLVLDAIVEREHAHVYDYIVLSLIDIFRAWETATTVVDRVALQLRADQWTLEELIAVREVVPLRAAWRLSAAPGVLWCLLGGEQLILCPLE